MNSDDTKKLSNFVFQDFLGQTKNKTPEVFVSLIFWYVFAKWVFNCFLIDVCFYDAVLIMVTDTYLARTSL